MVKNMEERVRQQIDAIHLDSFVRLSRVQTRITDITRQVGAICEALNCNDVDARASEVSKKGPEP